MRGSKPHRANSTKPFEGVGVIIISVSYTHLTLPTNSLV